jgi:hypothetical protein
LLRHLEVSTALALRFSVGRPPPGPRADAR